ncbi:PREDICTED: hemoglobin subunit alpha-5-like [Nanorana parkeri]|uniref:hemoglobin subunit alpha-5-like n=1 Tax=Nanorana parkeri TaxID=125878 RepID=UPI0008541523|nr:PREDICTED: hemoglobin subunit alpha-5-like [Nanorana parkeri]
MTFTTAEKASITSIRSKVAGHESDIGAEALERLFLSFPQTKTYFSHFDLSHGSKDLQNHGGKVVKAIGSAAQHLDDLDYALSSLSELHAHKLRVDPGNFRLLSHAIQVTLAIHFPIQFTADAQAAWDKFLSAVSSILVSKYR